MLGLPARVRACLFDLDGVLTQTAKVHAAAWKKMFDDCLRERAARAGAAYVPFDAVQGYDGYVNGKPRADGPRGKSAPDTCLAAGRAPAVVRDLDELLEAR